MRMDRRNFLVGGSAAVMAALLPQGARAGGFAPTPGAWRRFEVVTASELTA
jgi:hypothetical protein